MQKKPRYFILLLLLMLIVVIMMSFFLSYSWSPREEEAPKRSRPVCSFAQEKLPQNYVDVCPRGIEL
ncbi:MAG: hypothetical protein GXZ07_05475 [Firmicutes bacterium]|nr:hypothetical protein [Bacillota bacterium]